jgi:hypothetical protein
MVVNPTNPMMHGCGFKAQNRKPAGSCESTDAVRGFVEPADADFRKSTKAENTK